MEKRQNYWKSLEELYYPEKNSETKLDEFKDITGVPNPEDMPVISRRRFFALISSLAAVSLTGCTDYFDKGEIVPYNKKPEELTPGVPLYYASTCAACDQCCGILIKTREGRPIKVDGNPEHPINKGKICAKGQASILNLYDPYRLREPQYVHSDGRIESISWEQTDSEIVRKLRDAVNNKKEIAFIIKPIYSPTAKKVLDEFKELYPTTKFYCYSSTKSISRTAAWQKCYSSEEIPVILWENAKIIVALEADILGIEGMSVEQIRKFATRRSILKSGEFNRLYSIEGTVTLTGANADARIPLNPKLQLDFVNLLIGEIRSNNNSLSVAFQKFAEQNSISIKTLQKLITDLRSHKGEAIVYAGDNLDEDVHIAVNYLNELLGNTALYSSNQKIVTFTPLSPVEEFLSLIEKMKNGNIGALIHFNCNPVYQLPKELNYKEALRFVPFVVTLTESFNETSKYSTVVLPVNHDFESWGDFQVRTGILSLQQPVITPLYNTRQKEAVILSWVKGAYSNDLYHKYLMERWKDEMYTSIKPSVDFKKFWFSALHDGIVELRKKIYTKRQFNINVYQPKQSSVPKEFTIGIFESYYLSDGTFANNGWLQELPHPISKVVWDNYAAISPKTAEKLGLTNNDVVEITLPHGSVQMPVFIQPGQADYYISLSLGYGRTSAGPVGSEVGVNIQSLISKTSINYCKIYDGSKVAKTGLQYRLVSTQEHHSLRDVFLKDLHLKRHIIQEGTLEDFKKNPEFLQKHKTEQKSITKEIQYTGVKWAMAIDLNKCVGCSACVASCSVENNIPVVGKEQVERGREMHWIRIDRYYSGSEDNPSVRFQPMLCQHCDNAPCENVCPVNATNHSPDGLNQMVYNRCVGTRYCSNNCPYKVRRFNFFNWRDYLADGYYRQQPMQLLYNPEVTIRSRGVIEKCTFCVQRIMEARQRATEQGRQVNGTDVKTACQEACPADAIVFGDMNDSDSEVTLYRNHPLGYFVLEELNVKPNVTYVAKLTNI